MEEVIKQIMDLQMISNFEECLVCVNEELMQKLFDPIGLPYLMKDIGDNGFTKFKFEYYFLCDKQVRFNVDEYYITPKVYVVPKK